MIKIERIMVPTDFSECSKEALKYGCEFARQFGAELHLFHVLPDLALIAEPGLAITPEEYLKELREGTEKAMQEFVDDEMGKGLTIVREITEGVPFVEIIRYARDKEVDMIVIGTHGRTGIAHVLLGSVAEKVVRKAPCPVLTVRPDQHEFVLP